MGAVSNLKKEKKVEHVASRNFEAVDKTLSVIIKVSRFEHYYPTLVITVWIMCDKSSSTIFVFLTRKYAMR